MAERINELERLNELRRKGALTSDEYQREKSKLLDSAGASDTSYWHRNRNWLITASGVVGLLLAVFVIKPLLAPKPDSAGAVAETTTSGDPWAISSKRDPMSDATVTTATATIAGDRADLQVAVSCSSVGYVKYEVFAFDKQGDPDDMLAKTEGTGEAYHYRTFVPYELRIDSGAPEPLQNSNPRASNGVFIEGRFNSDDRNWIHSRMARGSRLVFGLHLTTGDETLVIDQSSPTFRQALAPCAKQPSAQ